MATYLAHFRCGYVAVFGTYDIIVKKNRLQEVAPTPRNAVGPPETIIVMFSFPEMKNHSKVPPRPCDWGVINAPNSPVTMWANWKPGKLEGYITSTSDLDMPVYDEEGTFLTVLPVATLRKGLSGRDVSDTDPNRLEDLNLDQQPTGAGK